MSSISQRQHHSINQEQTCINIIRLIQQNELEDPNTFLVINGGTGVGKTHAIMTAVQEELCKKFNHKQAMLVVESRTAMVQQAETIYENQIFCIGNINVCQRIHFMNLIQHNQLIYDWIVIDECHGLFSEASFAEDAEFIANWIRCGRAQNTHIIFVTANDEYFDDLSKKFFPDSYNFIYLFPDFTQYVSNTYVKEIQFIKTNRFETVINNFLHSHQNQKGIIFLKKASDVKDWFFRLLEENYNVGMIVSQANTTAIELTTKQAENLILDLSNGKIGLTMADLCTFYDHVGDFLWRTSRLFLLPDARRSTAGGKLSFLLYWSSVDGKGNYFLLVPIRDYFFVNLMLILTPARNLTKPLQSTLLTFARKSAIIYLFLREKEHKIEEGYLKKPERISK